MYWRPGSSTRTTPLWTPGTGSTVIPHVSITSTSKAPSGSTTLRNRGRLNPK